MTEQCLPEPGRETAVGCQISPMQRLTGLSVKVGRNHQSKYTISYRELLIVHDTSHLPAAFQARVSQRKDGQLRREKGET